MDFWSGYAWPTILIVLQIMAIVLPLLVAVAYLTYAERKGIPFVVIQGTKELELGVAQLKDIRVGEQVEVAVADLAARILADQA